MEKKSVGVQTIRKRKRVVKMRQRFGRRVRIEVVSCLRQKLSVKKKLKLKIWADALNFLETLPEPSVQNKDLKIVAAALISFGFALHAVRDDQSHIRAETLCKQRLGMDLIKGPPSQRQFAAAKSMIIWFPNG